MSPSCDAKANAANEVAGVPVKLNGAVLNDTGSSDAAILPDKFYKDHYLSDAAKARKPSPIRSLFPIERRPGMISLLAGKPNPQTYPFLELSFVSRDPHDHSKSSSYTVDPAILTESLQYGPTNGLPQFVDWLTELQERVHGRSSKEENWRISIGTGSQDMVNKAFVAIVNPGDVILIERPVYAAVIPLIESLGATLVDAPTDGDGVRPDSLRKILESWPSDKPKPKALYTIPYGGNPSGTTIPEARRIEVLALAREHNFLIFEDDPYYYLYYGEAERPASYFTLEKRYSSQTEPLGRVLRFDSLSKVLSAGMRIGLVSGPAAVLQAIDRHVRLPRSSHDIISHHLIIVSITSVIFSLPTVSNLHVRGSIDAPRHPLRICKLPQSARPWHSPCSKHGATKVSKLTRITYLSFTARSGMSSNVR
jgi:tryptophan aminotransferase